MKDIKEILASVFRIKPSEISNDTEIKDVDSWDSLTHMEMIAALEQEFKIEFDADEIMSMTIFSTIQELVNKRLNNGN